MADGRPLAAPDAQPFARLADRVPAVLFVAENGRPVEVEGDVEGLLGRPGADYVREPWRWDGDRRRLHEISTTVEEDGVRRTYGVLVAADPAREPVTGLPGRGLLLEHARLAAARSAEEDRRVALRHVLLNRLELVAAGLGRDAHEQVVAELGRRLRATLPPTALLAAVGDGEFAVLLADLDGSAEQVAEAVAGKLIVVSGQPLRADGEEFELGARVGVSLLPGDASDAEALARHAEGSARQALRTDTPSIVVYDGGTSEAVESLLLTSRLRRGIEAGELLLHYQPIIGLPSGEIAGVEALVRWDDPVRGLVAPADFIPVAEVTGLIEPLGRWVVEACCRQAAAWRDEGLQVPVSFNVSPRQFRDPRFAEHVRDSVAAHDLDPAHFTVEITESVAMRDAACVEPVLRELRALGLRLAIDDFGVGYSSLARLRELDVDLLKIDRAFLSRAPADARAGRLIQATLELIGALDMTPVAEGVETEQQCRFLADRGCPLVQGYHLGRPQAAPAVTELLRSGR
jgi:EAL domain-containing protein (putative c-di-GMP-specific phosphodiesterase class I)/GGDEF domain-containing protein